MPRESLADAVQRLERAGVAQDELRARGAAALARARPDRASHRGDEAERARRASAARVGCSRSWTTRRSTPARRRRRGSGAGRGGDAPLADGRGTFAASARRRRDPARALVLRAEPAPRRRSSCSPTTEGCLPDAPAPFRFGTWIGGDLDGNPSAGAGDDRRGSRPAPARSLSTHVRGRGSRARAGDRDLESARRNVARARRLDRPRRAGASRVRSRARGSQRRRAVQAQAQLRLEAPAQRARGRRAGLRDAVRARVAISTFSTGAFVRGRADRVADGRLAALRRRVELFGFHLAKLDVRLHAERSPRGLPSALGRRSLPSRGPARGTAPRPSTRSIVSGTCVGRGRPRALDLGGGAGIELSLVPLFETIDVAALGRGDRGATARRSALRSSRLGARRAARGDGRLLGLRQGRRLPHRAVGDLPGTARRSRALASERGVELTIFHGRGGSAGSRRRTDPRGDPRAAARTSARAAQAHRAG